VRHAAFRLLEPSRRKTRGAHGPSTDTLHARGAGPSHGHIIRKNELHDPNCLIPPAISQQPPRQIKAQRRFPGSHLTHARTRTRWRKRINEIISWCATATCLRLAEGERCMANWLAVVASCLYSIILHRSQSRPTTMQETGRRAVWFLPCLLPPMMSSACIALHSGRTSFALYLTPKDAVIVNYSIYYIWIIEFCILYISIIEFVARGILFQTQTFQRPVSSFLPIE
jgi:hypothetical protein